MHNETIVVYDESTGKDFTVRVYAETAIRELQDLIEAHKGGQDDEYPTVGSVDGYGREITKEMRDADLLEIQEAIELFTNEDHKALAEKVIAEQPRKKNGSFAKGRVNNLFQFDSYGVYWEESYGANTPAIRTRAIGDYEVEISYEQFVVKY